MKRYPEDIQKHINECQEHRTDEPAKTLSSARILRTYAKENHDDILLAHADYYMANSSYVMNDLVSCLHYLKLAVKGFEKTENYEDQGFCYNLMGLVYTRMGNAAGAISAYLKALRIAEEQHIPILGAYAEMNCADLCLELEHPEEALHYLLLSEAFLEKCSDNPRAPFVYVVAVSEAAITAYRIKDMDAYYQQTVLLKQALKDHPEQNENIDLQLLQIIADESKDEDVRNEQIQKLWGKLKNDPAFLDYHNEIIYFIQILYETGNTAILDDLLDRLNKESGELPLGMQTAISSFCIQYYKDINRDDLLQEELLKYFVSAEALNRQREETILSLLSTRMDLAVSRRTNQLLEKAADTDALTDHPNRRAFNTKADQLFDNAKKAHISLGLEMLDIDNFKNVNDTYGHTVGDDALIAVARALQSLDNEKIWSARYGGDEFVVLFYDCSDEEVRSYMHALKTNIIKEQSMNRLPFFTISQGAINRIPTSLNRVWDFNYAADAALYEVKKRGKDMSILIHEVDDLNNPNIEVMKVEQ